MPDWPEWHPYARHQAAKMAETMKLALEATEPCDVAVTRIQTAAAYEEWLESLRETPLDPETALQ
jgi:hypothetical protein